MYGCFIFNSAHKRTMNELAQYTSQFTYYRLKNLCKHYELNGIETYVVEPH